MIIKSEIQEIDNPEYQADDDLYMRDDWGAVGIDIWFAKLTQKCYIIHWNKLRQVKSGTIFDNILVADSVEDAKKHAAETFDKLKEAEKKQKEAHDEEERKKFE